ncbi:MAG: aspartyl/asparaginyl beta-hydroxylase domain-containing protein [Alphaproteobacteria bacterium]
MITFYDFAAAVIRRIFDSRIAGPPVMGCETLFPEAKAFAGSWRAIRDEALSIAGQLQQVPRFHEIMPEQTAISANDGHDWRMFIMKAYGVEVPRNMARSPTLAALVAASPAVLSASFSFLAPGKHIPAHRGPFRGVLRFYLVLQMPKAEDGRPAAVLKIADEEYRLAEGDYLLWDDTFRHEVWNAGDETRTVLLLDVWRPNMPIDMILFSKILIAIVWLGIRWRGVV